MNEVKLMIEIGLKIIVVLSGIWLITVTLFSAIRNFVLPRSSREPIAWFWFTTLLRLFNVLAHPAKSYDRRDQVMAFYAPISLVTIPIFWLVLVMLGYTLIFWGIGIQPLDAAMRLSVSSIMTLGFVMVDQLGLELVVFSEAVIGLVLVALLISYLPTIYSAFSRREALVTMLEVRAGSPPTAIEMLSRYRPQHSWITAAGAVLDTASLVVSSVDIPHDVQADICIRSGYISLRHIADFFAIPYDPAPHHHDDISITREEFDDVYNQLKNAYDTVLLTLAALTMAPYAPWSADRSPVYAQAWVRGQRRSSLFSLSRSGAVAGVDHQHE
jgi:hypothetical protein